MSEENTAQMIKVAAQPPRNNASAIVDGGLIELGFRSGAAPLSAFGITVGSAMAVVPGRILPPPGIKYGKGTPKVDERASWNLRDVTFAKGVTLANWVVLLIKESSERGGGPPNEFNGPNDEDLGATITSLANMCKQCGIKVPNQPTILVAKLPPRDSADVIRSNAIRTIRTTLQSTQRKPEFALVLLSSGDKHVYNGIKHLCDSYLDLPTLCSQSSKIRSQKGALPVPVQFSI